MKQPINRYNISNEILDVKTTPIWNERCCSNCILYHNPDNGEMHCKIMLRSFEQEFTRTVHSLHVGTHLEISGYEYDEAGYYSWMDLLGLIAGQKKFTALYGCGMFVKNGE